LGEAAGGRLGAQAGAVMTNKNNSNGRQAAINYQCIEPGRARPAGCGTLILDES
jgi:hypothetical protein